jgi:hypothetical protein
MIVGMMIARGLGAAYKVCATLAAEGIVRRPRLVCRGDGGGFENEAQETKGEGIVTRIVRVLSHQGDDRRVGIVTCMSGVLLPSALGLLSKPKKDDREENHDLHEGKNKTRTKRE